MASGFLLECPICGFRAEGYEEFLEHVVSRHPDKLWARFRGKVVKT